MIQIDEARVCKTANGGVGLYVLLRGTRDEVMGEAGLQVVSDLATKHGWNPEGRGRAGYPTQYGLTTYTRAFWLDQCDHGYPDGECGHLDGMEWHGFSGTGPSLIEVPA